MLSYFKTTKSKIFPITILCVSCEALNIIKNWLQHALKKTFGFWENNNVTQLS